MPQIFRNFSQTSCSMHPLELLVKRMVLTPETEEHEDPGTAAPPLGTSYCVILRTAEAGRPFNKLPVSHDIGLAAADEGIGSTTTATSH